MRPYVGAVVHYKDRLRSSTAVSAAIITEVHDETWVALFIISAGGGTRYASHVERGLGWEWVNAPAVLADEALSTWDGL